MKITTVLSAVNYNDKYIRFVPLFIHQWKSIFPELNIVIVFIGNKIPSCLQPYKSNIVLFPEIEGITSAYVAQTIRLLYPAILGKEETTIITDIDMLPGRNIDYYTTKIKDIADDTFVSMRPLSVVGQNEIAMCYNIARTDIWASMFKVYSKEDIVQFLTKNWAGGNGLHGSYGWTQDQHILYRFVHTNSVKSIILNDLYMKRLDFVHHGYDKHKFISELQNPLYSDAHMYADACTWSWNDVCELVKHI